MATSIKTLIYMYKEAAEKKHYIHNSVFTHYTKMTKTIKSIT